LLCVCVCVCVCVRVFVWLLLEPTTETTDQCDLDFYLELARRAAAGAIILLVDVMDKSRAQLVRLVQAMSTVRSLTQLPLKTPHRYAAEVMVLRVDPSELASVPCVATVPAEPSISNVGPSVAAGVAIPSPIPVPGPVGEMCVRDLRSADIDEWVAMWNKYRTAGGCALWSLEEMRAITERFLDPTQPQFAFVATAEDNGRLLGFAHCVTHRSCWTVNDYMYLQELFVLPDARRHGVGRTLLSHCVTWARTHGCARLHWITDESNLSARRLYDQMCGQPSGFVQYQHMLTDADARPHTALDDTLVCRPVTAADHDQWLMLWQGYQEFYHTTITEEVTRLTWQRFFDPTEPMDAAVVSDADGQLLGMVHFVQHRSGSTVQDRVYLQDLFTASAARGRGVGRRLISYVYDAARRSGAVRVHWFTKSDNAVARRLYDSVATHSGKIQYRLMF
jgi:GNAT superfamily N-acetyltransferase